MFFMKIFKFLFGYVIISLNGHSIERFINICIRRQIQLLSIRKKSKDSARITIYMRDFKRLRPIAYKTRTKVHIEKKAGLRMLLRKYKKRYVLFAGCLLCIILLFVTSNFIWIVEIEGVETADMNMVLAAVEETGIHVGMRKSELLSGNEMKDIILNNTRDISWAWVYIKGTKAVVQIKESVLSPQIIDKNEPCDIVSMRDGVIKNITAKEGMSVLQEGDPVLAGEVVIAGTLPSVVYPYRLVHALGTVEAYTYHKKTGTYKTYNEVRRPTGNKKTHITIQLFSKKINLFKNSSISYEEYDTIENNKQFCIGKDNFIGIGVTVATYKEVEVMKEPISYETAIEIAKNDLEEKIAKELIAGADLQKSTVKEERIDDETINVTLEMEFLEKIGSEQKIVQQKQE